MLGGPGGTWLLRGSFSGPTQLTLHITGTLYWTILRDILLARPAEGFSQIPPSPPQMPSPLFSPRKLDWTA